jgi:DNA-binding transcriptional regulator PaaX
MGVQERQSRKRSKRTNLTRLILAGVKTAGLLSVALVAPNVIGGMAKLGIIATRRHSEYIERSCERMLRSGLLESDGHMLRLSKDGERRLRWLELADFKIPKPRRWDKKWRILMFDIPEKRKSTREQVRRTLAQIGFVHLQDSVWVCPYDCEDIITLLKADFKIGKEMLYVIADSIEGDFILKRVFDL